MASVVTISSQGAGTGETAATNTTAIHNARDTAGTDGVVDFDVEGTLSVNALTASTNSQKWLIRHGVTVQLASGQNTDAIHVTGDDVIIEGEGYDSIIDQGASGQTGGAGLYIDGAPRCTVRNLRVYNCYNKGLDVTNGSPDFEADHVKVDAIDSGDSIAVTGDSGSDRPYVHDCHLTDGAPTGDADLVSIHGNAAGGTVHGARVQDNYIEVIGTDAFGIEIGPFGGDSPCVGALVTGNRIVATGNCFGGISMDDCAEGVVSDNIYDQNGQTGTNGIGGIELPGAHEMTVVGNVIVGDSELHHPISIDRASRNIIVGNLVKGWRNTGSNLNGGICITTSSAGEDCNDNLIANNTFVHPSSTITAAGIAMQSNNATAAVNRNLIHGNHFYGGNVASSRGVLMQMDSGEMNDNAIHDNFFYNLPTGIEVGADVGADNRLSPNKFDTVTTPYDTGTWDAISAGRAIPFVIDGGGSVISTGVRGPMVAPFAGYIVAAAAYGDQSGTAQFDIWKDSYANYPPTNADSITAAAPLTITSTTHNRDTTLTGWTRSFSAGDAFMFNVDSLSSFTRVTIILTCLEIG